MPTYLILSTYFVNAPIGTVVSSALESSAVAVLRLLSNLGAIVALHMLVVFVIFRGAALHSDLINHFWFGYAHKKFAFVKEIAPLILKTKLFCLILPGKEERNHQNTTLSKLRFIIFFVNFMKIENLMFIHFLKNKTLLILLADKISCRYPLWIWWSMVDHRLPVLLSQAASLVFSATQPQRL